MCREGVVGFSHFCLAVPERKKEKTTTESEENKQGARRVGDSIPAGREENCS